MARPHTGPLFLPASTPISFASMTAFLVVGKVDTVVLKLCYSHARRRWRALSRTLMVLLPIVHLFFARATMVTSRDTSYGMSVNSCDTRIRLFCVSASWCTPVAWLAPHSFTTRLGRYPLNFSTKPFNHGDFSFRRLYFTAFSWKYELQRYKHFKTGRIENNRTENAFCAASSSVDQP